MTKKRTELARRERQSRLITLRVVLDREHLQALRRVRGDVIRNERDARAALGRLLVEKLEELVGEMSERGRTGHADLGVDDLDLSVRAAHVLRNSGISLVRDLAKLSEGEIRKFTNSSAKVAREIAEQLERFGVRQVGTNVGGRASRQR